MQLHFVSGLTSEQYVRTRGWEQASLDSCPLHPEGGCGFCRHGAYSRKTPSGVRIARYYCRKGTTTFSLLPDFLASRLPGTLQEVQQVVEAAERSSSVWATVEALDLEASLLSAARWVRRRNLAPNG